MHQKKVGKLHKDILGFLETVRTAGVRLEGRLKVAAQADAREGPDRDTLLKLAEFGTGLIDGAAEFAKGLPAVLAKITDKAAAEK